VPITRVARSTLFYEARHLKEDDEAMMRRIDILYLKWPFYGSRRITQQLRSEGLRINCKRILRLMREAGLEAIYPKPNLSKSHPQHKKYPYLLRNLAIDRVNQVWGCDITYVPLARGHVYLVAIIDWYNCYVFVEALKHAGCWFLC